MKRILTLFALLLSSNLSFAQFTTSGSNLYHTSGNVGIGTTNPSHLLNIYSNSGGVSFTTSFTSNDLIFNRSNNGASYISKVDAGSIIFTTGSPSTNRLTLTTNGDLGIGTVSPSEKLEVTGNIQVTNSGANRSIMKMYAQGTGEAGIYFDASNGDGVGSDYGSLIQKDYLGIELNNYGNSPIHLRTANQDRLTITGGGNVGIGTTAPSEKLHVIGKIYLPLSHSIGHNPSVDAFTYDGTSVGNYSLGWYSVPGSAEARLSGYGGIKLFTNRETRMAILSTGNVGIGTTSPSEKLEVNGTIRTKKVKVEATGWPDYVFAENYKLRTLNELEQYIKANKHLPEVPSAAAIETNGLDLGAMDATLLKKVEELTLYLIEMKKEIEELKEENKALKEKVGE